MFSIASDRAKLYNMQPHTHTWIHTHTHRQEEEEEHMMAFSELRRPHKTCCKYRLLGPYRVWLCGFTSGVGGGGGGGLYM